MRFMPIIVAFAAGLATTAIDHNSLGGLVGRVESLVGIVPSATIRAEVGALSVPQPSLPPVRPLPLAPTEVPLEIPESTKQRGVEHQRSELPPRLVSIAREAWIFARPTAKSRRLGYLRAGAVVARSAKWISKRGCKAGWYRIKPRGYVCVSSKATLSLDHPVARLSALRPNMRGLPYTYVRSRHPTPAMYAALPSPALQREKEPSLAYFDREYRRLRKEEGFVKPPAAEPIPLALKKQRTLPPLAGDNRSRKAVYLRQARVRSGFALLANYAHQGRRFGLTTDLNLIPLDRTRVVEPSTFSGVMLSDEMPLPIAFVRSPRAKRFVAREGRASLQASGRAPYRSLAMLTGKTRRYKGALFHQTRDGSWLRDDRLAIVRKFKQAPRWARQGKKWIDVSILRQVLVAYEGRRPVFATMVSTGRDGIKDHRENHATIQGTFLIHTKHLSVTMDGDERGDEFDLRDVPFVQYFTEGYALHGVYWHDDFGTPRSHGCVNLAPRDAAHLFAWTTPDVPAGWHASLSLRRGTVVHIHP